MTRALETISREELDKLQRLPPIVRNILMCVDHRAGMPMRAIGKKHDLSGTRVAQILFAYGARRGAKQGELYDKAFGRRLRLFFPDMTLLQAIELVRSRQQ